MEWEAEPPRTVDGRVVHFSPVGNDQVQEPASETSNNNGGNHEGNECSPMNKQLTLLGEGKLNDHVVRDNNGRGDDRMSDEAISGPNSAHTKTLHDDRLTEEVLHDLGLGLSNTHSETSILMDCEWMDYRRIVKTCLAQ